MMCFNRHDIRCDLVLPIFLLVIYSNIVFFTNAVQNSKERSSIILYQGTDKYHLDAKDCPVGIALTRPERFSCACINGIWAFYENPCKEPVAIVGGNNHCFQMPAQPIRLVVAVSNPLRAMGEFLTVFEGNMDGIRSKIYRSIHMRLTDADKFVTLNSSWTLISPDGSKSICLESKNVIFDGLTSEEAARFPDASYCSFSDLSAEMPFIGTIKKGCNSSMVMEPTQCQPMLPNMGEEVCMSEQVLKDYQEISLQDVNADADNEFDESLVPVIRPSRSLKNLGRFLDLETTPGPFRTVTAGPVEIIDEVVHAYRGEPEWHRRLAATEDSNSTSQPNSTARPSQNNTQLNEIDLAKAWDNPRLFLVAPRSNSNILVTNHLWMYRRVEIRNALNITRLVPPEDDMAVQIMGLCKPFQETEHISLPSNEGNDTVHVQLDIPEVFRTKNFEPVIEAVWKIFLTVHSYCFKDFSDQYQDHHKYTMLMMGLFSSQIHDIWVRNQSIALEYGGILGNVAETMQGLENCAAGARLTSEYPFHMNRPTKLTKYQEEDEDVLGNTHERSKRSAPEVPLWKFEDSVWDNTKIIDKSSKRILSRKKRLTVNSVNAENRIGDTIFNGRGICLKKYGDQRAVISNHCRKRSIK